MRHFRVFKLKKDNTEDYVNCLETLSKSKIDDWIVDEKLKIDFSKENEIPSDHLLVFRSPYFTYIKNENEKRVFRGIIFFGVINNSLQIFEIKDEIENQQLPIHLYNFVLHQFIENVIESSKILAKNFFGEVTLKKNKLILAMKEPRNKNPKKSLVISTSPDKYEIFNKRLKKPIYFLILIKVEKCYYKSLMK